MFKTQVSNSYRMVEDPLLKELILALDPEEVAEQFNRELDYFKKRDTQFILKQIRVSRYKKGRRVLIEYDLKLFDKHGAQRDKTFIGKIRSRHSPKTAYKLLQVFWQEGFHKKNPERIAVSRPIGIIPKFNMWLQEKVEGDLLTDLLDSQQALKLMKKAACTAYRIHQAKIKTEKKHTLEDELRLLEKYLNLAAEKKPAFKIRIKKLFAQCRKLARLIPKIESTGIHRDFYPDQMIVKGKRLFVIDFDLYCQGDPNLDIGNFLSHLTERALRRQGKSNAYTLLEQEFENQYVNLAGENNRLSIRIYALLSLARHIYLSTVFADRAHLTEKVLAVCEEKICELIR